jgi:hypothetical protein
MKLYKKLFDIEEFCESKAFIDEDEAEELKKQFEKNYNLYIELYEYDESIVADLIVIENDIKKKLNHISYKNYLKNYKNDDDFATVTCFYEELWFSLNNIWENNEIW